MEKGDYDAIIVGGSFAGLATAYFTEAESLLILEREKDIGARQRSTCGAKVEWIKRLGAEESILRKFDTVTFHSPKGYEVEVDIPTPYCTIDYKVLCDSLSGRLKNTEIKTASKVTGVENGDLKKVLCGPEEYSSQILVDASGLRAAVASQLKPGYADLPVKIAGIETETEYDTDSCHFYFGKKIAPGGYAWIFPTAEGQARVGVGCVGKLNLLDFNKRFLDSLGIQSGPSGFHGGIIPCSGLRDPVVDGVFAVGDAGAQVLPWTAEGIRKAFDYGELCGGLISRVLNKEMEHREALDIYQQKVLEAKRFYDTLLFIQNISYRSPDWAWEKAIRKICSDETLSQRLLVAYFEENVNYTRFEIIMRGLKFLLMG